MSKREGTRTEKGQQKCICPYCEQEVNVTPSSFCQPCGITLRYCARCKIAVEREAKVCPKCGGPVA